MAVAAEAPTHTNYIFADSIDELGAARYAERERAQSILDRRRQGVDVGAEINQLLPIDALSTAHRVLDAARTYGEDSPQHRERLEGLGLDCQRLVAEWYRKLKPEWFPKTRHIFDADTMSFFSHGMSVRQMTENAITPIPDNPEEEARRINERVEDETPTLLRSIGGIALNGLAIRTISECTDKAIADYQHDVSTKAQHRGYGGYVPEREKLKVRDIAIDETTGDRYEEEIALPGDYITHSIVQTALERRGLDAWHLDKTGLHGAQILARDGLMKFVELLDTVAGEEWCVNVFMGEKVAKDFVKNYDTFPEEARRRQESQKEIALTVRSFVLDLAADGFDRRKAPAKVESFVKMLLLDLSKESLKSAAGMAADRDAADIVQGMFDEPTVTGLKEVIALEAAGRFNEAFEKLQEVEKQAPGGGYCGAGSCGLERLNPNSEKGKEIIGKLDAKPGDTIIKDNERSCRVCSRKGTVYYAYNSTKVNKHCTGCGATESKRTA